MWHLSKLVFLAPTMRCRDAEGEMNGKYQYYRMSALGRKDRKKTELRFSDNTYKLNFVYNGAHI